VSDIPEKQKYRTFVGRRFASKVVGTPDGRLQVFSFFCCRQAHRTFGSKMRAHRVGCGILSAEARVQTTGFLPMPAEPAIDRRGISALSVELVALLGSI